MKLLWTLPALEDLEGIQDFIRRDSEHWATQFIEKILTSVEKLVDFPKMGRIVPESGDRMIRELIYHGYRIIYRAEKERILILAVIHGARDLESPGRKRWEVS